MVRAEAIRSHAGPPCRDRSRSRRAFTALAVKRLVEAGEFELTLGLRGSEDFSGRPFGLHTIRQLLSHTSGFSTLQGTPRTRMQQAGR